MAGEATRLLERFGERCAAVVRVATLPPIVAVALLRAFPERLWPTLLVVVVAAAWTCGYCWWLSRRGRPPVAAGNTAGKTAAKTATRTAAVAVDAAALLAVCLIALWTDAVDVTNTGWLRLLVTFACVTWQWHTPPLAGAIAALAAGGGMLVTIAAAGLDVNAGQIWVLAMAALSRAVWVLVTRAAQRADQMAAEAERARRASAVAAAVRDEERELANALHDTAATTLLMVGTGQVRADATWLAAQARRDLARLRSSSGTSPAQTAQADLVGLLRADIYSDGIGPADITSTGITSTGVTSTDIDSTDIDSDDVTSGGVTSTGVTSANIDSEGIDSAGVTSADINPADIDSTHLTVDLDAPAALTLPFAVASAIAGATCEALNNVRRHAATDRAVVRVHGDAQALRVEIIDTGRGFSAEPGPARRGLRESVHGRMNRIGGTATITSAAGAGTTVRLEWRADRG